MSQSPADREIEELMVEARAVRGRYRAVEREEPPPHLDDAIRAAARREAGSRPRLAGSPFGSSWRIPLSIAAVVVVSATLTVMVSEQQRHLPEAKAPSPSSAPIPAPPPAGPAPLQAEQSKAEASKSTPTIRRKAAPDAWPAAPEPDLQSSAQRGDQERRQTPTSPSVEEQSAREAALPPQRTESESAPASDAAVEPAEQPRAGELAQGAEADSAAELSKRKDDEVSAASPPVAPASAAKPRAMSPPPSALRDSARERGLAAKQLATPRPPWEHDPALWLQRIDELRKAGQVAQARASFEAFRKRFPDYKLPTDFVVPQ